MLVKSSLFFVFLILIEKSSQLSIECVFSHVTFVNRLYTCTTRAVWDFDEPEIRFINGTHENLATNNDVKGLLLLTSSLKYFPPNIYEFFPQIEGIQVGVNKIEELSSKYLQKHFNLTYFGMIKSQITSLPGDLFSSNPKMTFIQFHQNLLLESVGENFLGNLDYLQLADFSQNLCINSSAVDPIGIERIKKELLIQCPPSTTTTTTTTTEISSTTESGSCTCLNEIENLQNTITSLKTSIYQNTEQINELERIVRELTSEDSINHKNRIGNY
jgi:hypothetical protein